MNQENLPKEKDLIGKITHYFDHIGVAVIELSSPLSVGDNVRVVGGETDFTQQIESIEHDHKKIDKAMPGDSIGIAIGQKVRDGYRVYRV